MLAGESRPAGLAGDNIVGGALDEIRARVLGGRVELTPEDEARVQAELRNVREIDLNSMDHAFVNEDPALKAHIEASRRRLMEHERRMMRDPSRKANLRQNFIAAMRLASTTYCALKENNEVARNLVECTHLYAKHAQELSEGKQPRGYEAAVSTDAATVAGVSHIARDLGKTAQEFEAQYKQFVEVMNNVFLARRKFDEVGSGLLTLLEECEEDRRLLREHLQDLSRAVAVREAVDPASTLGEQLLAAPVLPEDAGIQQ